MPDLRHVQQAPGHPGLIAPALPSSAAARVACDLHGCGQPGLVLEGVGLALAADPALTIVLTGEPAEADLALVAPDDLRRLEVRPGVPVEAGPGDASRAVRGQRTASVRVAARLVRDGAADACVLLGPASVALAAARFALRLLPGATAPVVAAEIGASVLVDVSGRTDLDRAGVVPTALLGLAYARARGVELPRVGVLSAVGIADDDPAGRRLLTALEPYAHAGLLELGGSVDVADLVVGAPVPAVVVTDGFSGNVLREALEAAPTARIAVRTPRAGGVVLGLEGVAVVGWAQSPTACADALVLAARAARVDLAGGAGRALADLVAWRRMSAGLNPVLP